MICSSVCPTSLKNLMNLGSGKKQDFFLWSYFSNNAESLSFLLLSLKFVNKNSLRLIIVEPLKPL
jgi:hypothetical protein